MLELLIAVMLSQGPVHVESGRISNYAPNDGSNSGNLSCGGRLTDAQVHIAYRRWWKVGCGRRVLVCAEQTARCVMATVRDGGPYGIYRGHLMNNVVATPAERKRGRPRKGWKWRGLCDTSPGLHRKLGRPDFLSKVHLFFLPRSKTKE
jgi:hypothetical protein